MALLNSIQWIGRTVVFLVSALVLSSTFLTFFLFVLSRLVFNFIFLVVRISSVSNLTDQRFKFQPHWYWSTLCALLIFFPFTNEYKGNLYLNILDFSDFFYYAFTKQKQNLPIGEGYLIAFSSLWAYFSYICIHTLFDLYLYILACFSLT